MVARKPLQGCHERGVNCVCVCVTTALLNRIKAKQASCLLMFYITANPHQTSYFFFPQPALCYLHNLTLSPVPPIVRLVKRLKVSEFGAFENSLLNAPA